MLKSGQWATKNTDYIFKLKIEQLKIKKKSKKNFFNPRTVYLKYSFNIYLKTETILKSG